MNSKYLANTFLWPSEDSKGLFSLWLFAEEHETGFSRWVLSSRNYWLLWRMTSFSGSTFSSEIAHYQNISYHLQLRPLTFPAWFSALVFKKKPQTNKTTIHRPHSQRNTITKKMTAGRLERRYNDSTKRTGRWGFLARTPPTGSHKIHTKALAGKEERRESSQHMRSHQINTSLQQKF